MLCETIGRVCCPSYLADFQLFFGTPTLGRTAQLHRCDASGSLRPNALLFAMRCWHLSKHAVRPFFKPKSSSPSCLMNMISRPLAQSSCLGFARRGSGEAGLRLWVRYYDTASYDYYTAITGPTCVKATCPIGIRKAIHGQDAGGSTFGIQRDNSCEGRFVKEITS